MDVKQIEKRVESIRQERLDGEAAHGDEDRLHQDVLAWIVAHGDPTSAALAKAALETLHIPFARWCA